MSLKDFVSFVAFAKHTIFEVSGYGIFKTTLARGFEAAGEEGFEVGFGFFSGDGGDFDFLEAGVF